MNRKQLGVVWGLLGVLLTVPSASQTPDLKKDIPALTREAVKAVVLVVSLDRTGKEIRQGSGFVVSRDGKVVTNYHVVAGADSAMIKFSNGAFYLIEGILAADQERDAVVLKASGKDFPFLSLGDSERVQVGEEVIAIGSPLALEATVSNGIVSSIRELEQGNLKVIQTTAPVSPGSSGGALLNLEGEVIGVTTFQLARGQNLNFAVPVSYIKPLLAGGRVSPLGREPEQAKLAAVSSGIPEVWTSLTSGSDYRIRIEGDYLYQEWLLPTALKQAADKGAFTRCEYKRDANKWAGKCHSLLPHHCSSWSGSYINWCRTERKIVITSVTATRIEGEAEGFDRKDFDCGKCKIKRTTWKPFVWIPKK